MNRRTCFTSFLQLLFSVLTKRMTIYEVRVYTFVYSYNLETVNHITHVIFLLHSIMKTHLNEPENLLTNLLLNVPRAIDNVIFIVF